MFKINPIRQAIFEGFFQRITAIDREPDIIEPLKDFGVPNYGFMMFDYNYRNYNSDNTIGNMLHLTTYFGGWYGNRDHVIYNGVSESVDLQFDLTPDTRFINLQTYIDNMSEIRSDNRSPKFLVTYHVSYDLPEGTTPERLYLVRFSADYGAYLYVQNNFSSSRLPRELRVTAPAKVNVRIIKVFKGVSIYDPEWREISLSVSGQNPFTLTAAEMFHPEPMTFLTFDAYLRKLDKPLQPQLAAEFQTYVNNPTYHYADSINTMRLKAGSSGDHRLNGYDVLTLHVEPPRYGSSTEYYIRLEPAHRVTRGLQTREDRLIGSWYPNTGSNLRSPSVTDPLVGIIPEQINVTGRGDYYDDRDLSYADAMITYKNPIVEHVSANQLAAYSVVGYQLTIKRNMIEYTEDLTPYLDITTDGYLDIKVDKESGEPITLCTIKWKIPESTSDYLKAQSVIMSSINRDPDWRSGVTNYTVSVKARLIDTYGDTSDGSDPTRPKKPISVLFYGGYVDPPIDDNVIT
ncbi:hypothetical protein S1R3X_000035 [Vibrio phage vB_ValS_VA-RY-4]|nr:hypothetical protein S1R3X_000035 [Vibrio phage vB_ValS_VA-RY-4]CAH0448172.1 hypothetical protein SM030_00039 [Vibrio phage vB_VpaS_sm030]CAI6013101.1 hypothetical protein SM032_00039 [Vibrio phage vB_VpaS_sm030]